MKKESKMKLKSGKSGRLHPWENIPAASPAPEVPVKVIKRERNKELSATIEPCYCGEEDHYQMEIYEIESPDRITAKFSGVDFHLNLETATAMAKKINRVQRKSKSTSTEGTNKETTMKKSAKKSTKKSTTKTTKAPGLSNKAIIFQAVQKGITDREKLLKLVKGAVKETTVRSWIASWKRKDNLPAIAKA